MSRFLVICLGGAFGTGARYVVAILALRWFGSAFPYGTLAVNLAGSFLLAGLMHVGTSTAILSETTRLALTTGVMGGFTTYSSFSVETLVYLREGSYGLAAVYVIATVMGCLVASLLGLLAARALVTS